MDAKLKLYVTSLGRFSLSRGDYGNGEALSDKENTSWRMLPFLQYLCTFNDRSVSQEEIIDVLWDGVEISDPANTLKTLLHRSRGLLEKLGFPSGKEILLYKRGLYSWNPNLEIHMDIYEFDELYSKFAADPLSPEGLACAYKAFELYRGDFLPNAVGSPWAISPRAYYHSRYLQLCYETASALWNQNRLDEAIDVCRKATTLDPYDESCQLLMMQLFNACGNKQLAVQYYSEVSKLLMDQLGVTPSEEISAFYRELIKSDEMLEMDLQAIRMRLTDFNDVSGPMLCEYTIFQNIYRLSARTQTRTGQVIQLAIITLLDTEGECLPAGRCSAAMEELKMVIESQLRSGDVFTRFSPAQYLLLLPRANYENGAGVLHRVIEAYKKTLSGKTTTTEFSLLPVVSQGQIEPPDTPSTFKMNEGRNLA